jgi:hypothetical protein
MKKKDQIAAMCWVFLGGKHPLDTPMPVHSLTCSAIGMSVVGAFA